MGRHQQHRAAQRGALAQHQRSLLWRFDVACKQRAAALGVDHPQHATQRVGLGRCSILCRRRVQHLEADTVPRPMLAGIATLLRHAQLSRLVQQ